MSKDFIRVEPARDRRQTFADWAVAQTPKLRTVGQNAFAVPLALFPEAPEDVLIGALVDGHRYVSPAEDGTELLGVAAPEVLVTGLPGEPLPKVPEEAGGPDSAPLDESPAGDRNHPSSEVAAADAPFTCEVCDRDFTSTRGRDTHRRQAHSEA
ncbi:hypothetical protein [Streptomyces niveus]|uniref:hypothetical protein n=1 Tax=Streptomyces niveus TaxID=193462 RepID=UPI0036D24516